MVSFLALAGILGVVSMWFFDLDSNGYEDEDW